MIHYIGGFDMNFRVVSTIVACVVAIQVYAAWGSTKDFRAEIEHFPAWHGCISQNEAETALQNHKPFTFVLREASEKDHFIISFVRDDSSIGHVDFIFDIQTKKWFYKNGGFHYEDKIEALVPQMMHCDLVFCKILTVVA